MLYSVLGLVLGSLGGVSIGMLESSSAADATLSVVIGVTAGFFTGRGVDILRFDPPWRR